jgi:hypothetical protein
MFRRPTTTPRLPGTTPRFSRSGRAVCIIVRVLAALAGIAAGWATWAIHARAHPTAAIILAIAATLSVTELVWHMRSRRENSN